MSNKVDHSLLFQHDHPGNRIDGIQSIHADIHGIRIVTNVASVARLVLKSDKPLLIAASQGAEARLHQGWDGTLGYSQYGLELSIPGTGEAVVTLRAIQPPDKAVITTDEELGRFKKEYSTRCSRFPDNLEEFVRWQKEWRQKLTSLLMGGGLPRRVPSAASIIETGEYQKFSLHRVAYRSLSDRTNELLLSLPKGVTKAPLLVALHGHETDWGRAVEAAYTDHDHNDSFCAYFAERGWAVLQPATMKHELQHPEWTLQGEWSWDAMTAVDYAATVTGIDMDRIAVCGLSTGAHLAMNLLAFDDRIKAGVVGCILSTWHHYHTRFRIPPHCDCGIVGQIGSRIEQCDWAALAAPKPVQFQHGFQDAAFCPGADPALLNLEWNTGIMPLAEYETAFNEIQRAYRLCGAHGRTETRLHDGPHSIHNETAFAWLNRLKRQSQSAPSLK